MRLVGNINWSRWLSAVTAVTTATTVTAFTALTALTAMGAAVAAAGAVVPRQAGAEGGGVIDFKREIQPLLAEYCYPCHGVKKKADLDFTLYANEAAVFEDRKLFERVLKQLQSGEMPPEGKPAPTDAQRQMLTGWLEAAIFKCDCNNPDPGRVTIRRLNRTEYNNTIRDLFGLDFKPADDFPADDVGYGFDNIGDVLSLPPVLFEKYLAAADQILEAAIWEPTVRGSTNRVAIRSMQLTGGIRDYGRKARIFFSQGELFTEVKFPKAGEYLVRFRAFGQQAGPEPARAELRLGKESLKVFDVTAKESASEDYGVEITTEAGAKRIGISFINDFYREDGPTNNRDRNLIVGHLDIVGPIERSPMPEFHRRTFARVESVTNRTEAARRILSEFTRRAYRRAVSAEEIDRLMGLYERARSERDGFEDSVKLAMKAVMISPYFLFRGELQPQPDNPALKVPLSDFALASRLSYFLWSSMPDDELLGLAENGELRKQLESQGRRMLKDPKAKALVNNFAGQWLQLRKLSQVTPDPATFPSFNEDLRAAMLRETDLFFEAILRENRSVLEFLESDFTYANEPLARHYGLENVTGPEFRRVTLRGTARGGLLTQASILTLTSNPTRTSPVKRGKWVLDNILGAPPPPPPPNVPELEEGPELTGTLRQRLEQHRANPMCASCHNRMDPIGFGLEHFDAIGAWRERDGNEPLDTAGKLASGESFADHAGLRAILAGEKRAQFVRCLTEKMLTYALGRGLEYYDKCAVDRITEELAKKDYRFETLILEIAQSVPFQFRRGEGVGN